MSKQRDVQIWGPMIQYIPALDNVLETLSEMLAIELESPRQIVPSL
jgi:hypothetical protein